MNRGFPMRRLIHGLLGAAVAALLGAAHPHVPALEHGYAAAPGGIAIPGAAPARAPEWRAARERIPRAPIEKAARTRRPGAASGAGILPAAVTAGAVGAPVVLLISDTAELVALRSECGHCTRAARPPPIS
jgi:hypothetical protein